jgi:hypothetical protein
MKSNSAVPGGSLKSKPTWSNTSKYSAASAFFVLLRPTGAHGLDFLHCGEELALMHIKPSWMVLGAGMGLGVSLAVTTPSGLASKDHTERHREVREVQNAQGTKTMFEPTTASKRHVSEAVDRIR